MFSLTSYWTQLSSHAHRASGILRANMVPAMTWWFSAGLLSVLLLSLWHVLQQQLVFMRLHMPWYAAAIILYLIVEWALAVLSVLLADRSVLSWDPAEVVGYVTRRLFFCVLIRLMTLVLIVVASVFIILPGFYFAVFSSVFSVVFLQHDMDFFSLLLKAVDLTKGHVHSIVFMLLPWYLFNMLLILVMAFMLHAHMANPLFTLLYMVFLFAVVWFRCIQRVCLEDAS